MPKNKGIPMLRRIGDIILFLHDIHTMYTVFIKRRDFRQGRLWEVKQAMEAGPGRTAPVSGLGAGQALRSGPVKITNPRKI